MAGESKDTGDLFAIEDTFVNEVAPNRRTQPRVDATLEVSYQSLDELLRAYTTDISQGGLFLVTDKFLPTGSVVKIELQLPDGGPAVAIIARIAYVRKDATRTGMGVEFLDGGGAPITEQLANYLAISLGNDSAPDDMPPARILVVDDDKASLDCVTMVMRKCGHHVTTADNGVEALGLILREPPDLVLSDVQMPTMDGWQLLRILRGRPSIAHIPVVFLTTLATETERLKGYRLGVDDYIAKPFLYEELSLRVMRVLARARNRGTASKNALRGDLAQVTLTSVLQFVEIERRTGLLLVISGTRLATMRVREGRVVAVEIGNAPNIPEDPLQRLFEVMNWQEGRFDLTTAEVTTEDSIGKSTSFLLLEHARLQDERLRK